MPTLVVEESLAALSDRVAADVVVHATAAIATHGRFDWVLSGGSTPVRLYELFASDPRRRGAIDWARVHFFWSDERHVGPDHPESNYRMARDAMLAPLGIPAANVHRMRGENADAAAAARAYDEELGRFFAIPPGTPPRFDLALLGMGADGHTASLFPGSPALRDASARVLAPWVESSKAFRITLSVPVLNAASHVVFLVAGEDKAATLKRVLEGPDLPDELPSQRIRPYPGDVLWAVDRAAARELSRTGRSDE